MSGQTLRRVQRAFRIGDLDGNYFVFDGTGARMAPGRWNLSSSPMIYTSADYATSMLEKLVHGSGVMPPNQHYVEIILSVGLSYETADLSSLRDWDAKGGASTKAYGDAWFQSKRSLLLFVPSVVTRVTENILINPTHPQFSDIEVGRHYPVRWDDRLFSPPSPPPTPPLGPEARESDFDAWARSRHEFRRRWIRRR